MSPLAGGSRPSTLATPRRLHFGDPGGPAEIDELLGGAGREQVHAPGDEPRPTRLVARPEPGPVVPVEVLVEQEMVTPVRVVLELSHAAIHRSPALAVAQEDAGQPARELLGDLVQVHVPAGAGRTLNGEILAVEGV